jgi:hypothetical protein
MSFLSFDLALVLAVYVDVYVGGFPGDHSPLPIGGNRGSTPPVLLYGLLTREPTSLGEVSSPIRTERDVSIPFLYPLNYSLSM